MRTPIDDVGWNVVSAHPHAVRNPRDGEIGTGNPHIIEYEFIAGFAKPGDARGESSARKRRFKSEAALLAFQLIQVS